MPDLGCSPEARRAFGFLVSKGLRDFQAAAVIGNLQQESAFNPRAFNPNEGAYGIAQWRLDRWQSLLTFAQSTGRDPWQLDTQLDFLWNELSTNTSLGMNALTASSSLEDATLIFQDRFERCGVCATQNRVAFARAALLGCSVVSPPSIETRRTTGDVAIVTGVLALVTAAGWGVYKLLAARPPTPEPVPPWGYYGGRPL